MKTLIIPDLHLPWSHPQALEHCRKVYDREGCSRVVFLGDLIDSHSLSRYVKIPEMPSVEDEFQMAKEQLKQWQSEFPNASVTWGNHDRRIYNLAQEKGIPEKFMLPLTDILDIRSYNKKSRRGWRTGYRFLIGENTLAFHGEATRGRAAGVGGRTAKEYAPFNVVFGHLHTQDLSYHSSETCRCWGFCAGSLVDDGAPAFSYAKNMIQKPVSGCGVVWSEGKQDYPLWHPLIEPVPKHQEFKQKLKESL